MGWPRRGQILPLAKKEHKHLVLKFPPSNESPIYMGKEVDYIYINNKSSRAREDLLFIYCLAAIKQPSQDVSILRR